MKLFLTIAGVVLFLGAGTWYLLSRTPATGSPQVPPSYLGYSAGESEVPPQAQQAPAASPSTQAPATLTSNTKIMNATLHTNKGDIVLELLPSEAPNTVANFTKLAQDGFYNGTKFHRVIAGFMVQGGDPLTKDDSQMARWGTGGPGYTFADELYAGNSNQVGTIAMANAGPNTNGSQFFINVADNSFLNGKHVVFGKVISGMEVVKAIETTPTDQNDRPVEPVVVESITLR